jgi:hypothetical protein
MDFWERLEAEVNSKTSRKIVEFDLGIAANSFSNWKSRKTYPAVDIIVRLARHLHTTAEYLVDGEDGARYVRDLVQQEGGVFRPPKRIADIVDGLKTLDDVELNLVRGMVLAGAARHKEAAEGG